MGITFLLPHAIDFGPQPRQNWLWYSHGSVARGEVPTDRMVVSGWQDPASPGIRMAPHYFLTDFAHNMLSQGYNLIPATSQMWKLWIADRGQAAAFKLVFM